MDRFQQEVLEKGLGELGFDNLGQCQLNPPRAEVIEQAICLDEASLSSMGALTVNTAPFTGRSPNDKYLVVNSDPDLWFASGTQSLTAETFQSIKAKMTRAMGQRNLFVRDVFAGADPAHALRIRVITDLAWQNLAAANMFIDAGEEAPFANPDFTLLVSSQFKADPVEDKLRSSAFIILNFDEKLVLIGTTRYAGEIKKSVFTLMNYVLPKQGILSLHCSANKAQKGDVALFFGLSGTGKTTLSSDPNRALIGDDEHGWSDQGIFNFEGGCYAKTIRINPIYEPLVYSAINRFGALLENVPLDANHNPLFDDSGITENTRASYPLSYIGNYEPSGTGGHPNHIFFLTADAFGVLPPLACLTRDQALYYFLSGYTSKLAGTERGLGDKPEATFSTCFGAPFLPLKPSIYASLLAKRLEQHGTKVWLLNTGWSGGGYGVGHRIALPMTRAMIKAVLDGELNETPTHIHPVFNVAIPDVVPGVPAELLNPELSWQDKVAYYAEAQSLASKFIENFKKYKQTLPESVVLSGPNQHLNHQE